MIANSLIALTTFLFLVLLNFQFQNKANALTNGDPATNLLGQLDPSGTPVYTKNGTNNSPNNYGFSYTNDAAIDTTHHHLFVTDQNNNRILVYDIDETTDSIIDYYADHVLGQPDFYTTSGGCASAKLNNPYYLSLDAGGDRLFVSDYGNYRVVIYNIDDVSTGESAVNVLGQSDLSSCPLAEGAGPTNLRTPRGLIFDVTASRLFVADTNSNRIMVFDVAEISNGESAVNVLGQGGFSSSTSGTTQSTLNGPTDVAFNAAGQILFVADSSNYRVMAFDVAEISNGENAANLLGQTVFNVAGGGTTQNTFGTLGGLAYNGSNSRLFVGDTTNNRVMIFDLSTFENGENAANEFGHPAGPTAYTDSTSGTTQSTLYNVQGLDFDSTNNRLYVADQYNNRIMGFDTLSPIIDGSDAINVIGQITAAGAVVYTKGGTNSSPSGIGYQAPTSVLLDSVHHKLYVADTTNNNRILIYNLNDDDTLIDRYADNVLGQANLDAQATPSCSASSLSTPSYMAIDTTRHLLFVSDYGHSRVLIFNVETITDGESATNVIGQANLTTCDGTFLETIGEYIVRGPQGLVYYNNTLYVVDSHTSVPNANRVLVFDVTTISDYPLASYVIGQTDFATQTGGTSQSTLSSPRGLAIDTVNTTNRLFVGDSLNNRVMIFNLPITANGANAANVLGQSLFTTSTSGTTQSTLSAPNGLIYKNNVLYVADSSNNRVIGFDVSPTTITNGENATYYLGQSNFTGSDAAATQAGMYNPLGLEYDTTNSQLLVADSSNNRVSFFSAVTNSAPSISTTMTIAQQTDDGYVNIQYTLTDADNESDISLTSYIYSTDNGATWSATNMTAATGDSLHELPTPLTGTPTGASHTFVWDACTDLNDYYATALVRLTPNDGVIAGSAATSASSFAVDCAPPTGLASFIIGSSSSTASSSSISPQWTAASDNSFNHYEIWYGTTQSDVQGRTGTATEWDNSDDPTNLGTAGSGTIRTTISGLSVSTTYYLGIWAIDNFLNGSTIIETSVLTPAAPQGGTMSLVGSSSKSSSKKSSQNQSQQQNGEQPAGEQPTEEQPTGEQPTGEQPTGEQPTGEQPTLELPTDVKTAIEKTLEKNISPVTNEFTALVTPTPTPTPTIEITYSPIEVSSAIQEGLSALTSPIVNPSPTSTTEPSTTQSSIARSEQVITNAIKSETVNTIQNTGNLISIKDGSKKSTITKDSQIEFKFSIADAKKEKEKNPDKIFLTPSSTINDISVLEILKESSEQNIPLEAFVDADFDKDNLSPSQELYLKLDPSKKNTKEEINKNRITSMNYGDTIPSNPLFRMGGTSGENIQIIAVPVKNFDNFMKKKSVSLQKNAVSKIASIFSNAAFASPKADEDSSDSIFIGETEINENHMGAIYPKNPIENDEYYFIVQNDNEEMSAFYKLKVDESPETKSLTQSPEINILDSESKVDLIFVSKVLNIISFNNSYKAWANNLKNEIEVYNNEFIQTKKMAGKAAPGSTIYITWKSVIFSSIVIADANGEFELETPEGLENGDHEAIAYSMPIKGIISNIATLLFKK